MVKNAEKISSRKAAYMESVQQGQMSLLMKEMENIALEQTKKVRTEKPTRAERRALHEAKLASDKKKRLAKLGAQGEARRLAVVAERKARRMEEKEREVQMMEEKEREVQMMEERNRGRRGQAKAKAMAWEKASRFMSGQVSNNDQDTRMDIDGVVNADMLESWARKKRMENRNKASLETRTRIRAKAKKKMSRLTDVDTSDKDNVKETEDVKMET
jgi:hypothetical protein